MGRGHVQRDVGQAWTRPRYGAAGPRRIPRLPNRGLASDEVTDARKQLLAAVYAEPANDAPRAVYGDWLLEQGHPLGQFIQLQLARAGGKKGTAKEERLLAEHGATFWPEHPACVERVPPWSSRPSAGSR